MLEKSFGKKVKTPTTKKRAREFTGALQNFRLDYFGASGVAGAGAARFVLVRVMPLGGSAEGAAAGVVAPAFAGEADCGAGRR